MFAKGKLLWPTPPHVKIPMQLVSQLLCYCCLPVAALIGVAVCMCLAETHGTLGSEGGEVTYSQQHKTGLFENLLFNIEIPICRVLRIHAEVRYSRAAPSDGTEWVW